MVNQIDLGTLKFQARDQLNWQAHPTNPYLLNLSSYCFQLLLLTGLWSLYQYHPVHHHHGYSQHPNQHYLPCEIGVKNWYQRQLCIWLWLDNNIEKKQKQLGVEHLHRLSQAKSKKKENDDHIIMYTTCMSSSQVNFIYLNTTTCDVINRNSWSLTIGKRITRVGILSTAF